MTTDEITLITNTLTTLGSSGKEAFIWWLIASKALPAVGWTTFGLGLLHLVHRIFQIFSRNEDLMNQNSDLRVENSNLRVENRKLQGATK